MERTSVLIYAHIGVKEGSHINYLERHNSHRGGGGWEPERCSDAALLWAPQRGAFASRMKANEWKKPSILRALRHKILFTFEKSQYDPLITSGGSLHGSFIFPFSVCQQLESNRPPDIVRTQHNNRLGNISKWNVLRGRRGVCRGGKGNAVIILFLLYSVKKKKHELSSGRNKILWKMFQINKWIHNDSKDECLLGLCS